MKRKIIACLLWCATSAAALAQTQGNKIEFTEYTLPNGLHVILHKDNSTPNVAVSVLYHVGSKNEVKGRTGFAHFFEHLMFEGTENIDRGQYMGMVQAAGGSLNANTSFDRTYYYELLPSNQVALGLWMEAERMKGAKVDETGVETQRKVVQEEKRMRVDNQPYGTILENTFGLAYKEHPYKITPIGTFEDLNSAKIEEFRDFYKTFYVPNNATLSIAGDINIDDTKKMIEQYFGSIPKGTKAIPRPTIKEPKQTEERRKIVYDNIQLPAVIQAYHIPAQGTPDHYALSMLTTLLSGGESARLPKALVDKQQKAVAALSVPFPTEDPGLFLTYAIASVGTNAQDLEDAMNVEIERVKTEPLSDKEFQKLRNQIESQFVQQNSTVAGRAENLANYHVYYKDANLINTEIDRYMKVTKEDIQRVAKEYLTKDNRVVLHYLPKSAQPKQ
ncbi:insulinase family protein [Pontibacter sp. BT310]|jgi:zinc protease|uniref:Insulinase family protein n=1 Tax=Pontibacter populi TaxID=890055 RepID=A0ABS6X9C8_9BACT|nr:MULTISPECIES: pitrilysin family protein [Pontibacter]MBJ6117739.1 insulinase family protein [Pontibacter sp. BT310]MBR0570165.1 insulinase family protein [Microvirga sp. STS03]MBW3364591.1 insulinase family protein [Pontibacter populi]